MMKIISTTDDVRNLVEKMRLATKNLRATANTEGDKIYQIILSFSRTSTRLKNLFVVSLSEKVYCVGSEKEMSLEEHLILRQNIIEELYDTFASCSTATGLLLTAMNTIAQSKKTAEESLNNLGNHIGYLKKERSKAVSGGIDLSKLHEILAIDDAVMNYKAGEIMIYGEMSSHNEIDQAIILVQELIRRIIALIAFNEATLRQQTKTALAISTAYSLYASD